MELRREDAERIALAGGEPARELLLKLFDHVAEQSEKLEKLERRVNQNSSNSSVPSSKDPLGAPKCPPRKRSGRKQGGQKGHEGVTRELVENPDETIPVPAERCRKCGRELSAQDRVVGSPWRHQVIELPESSIITTEYQMMKVACSECGAHTRAELPAGVESGAFGPRLRATIVMLAAMLLSRRAIALILCDMFGAKLSTGSVEKIIKDAGAVLAGPWEAIKRAVQAAEVINADETSWRRAGQRLWLWTALSASAACFQIDPTRARKVAEDLLGDFNGILVSDRYGVYALLNPERRQVCLCHLVRNFQAFAEHSGAVGRHGKQIKELLEKILACDRRAREKDLTLCWWTGELGELHDQLMNAVEAGERSTNTELATICGALLDLWPALWNFTEHPDVDATNNRAERALRHAVLWRRISGGTQTDDGERFVERILSIRETCRIQDRRLHPYLIDVHNARLNGHPIPTPLAA